jgi:hypothetical protein
LWHIPSPDLLGSVHLKKQRFPFAKFDHPWGRFHYFQCKYDGNNCWQTDLWVWDITVTTKNDVGKVTGKQCNKQKFMFT